MLPIVDRPRRPFLFALFVCALVAMLYPPSASTQLGKPEGLYYKSWAIVIGVENYLLAPKIPGAIEDAKTVAQAFRRLGFDEVVELYGSCSISSDMQVSHRILTARNWAILFHGMHRLGMCPSR